MTERYDDEERAWLSRTSRLRYDETPDEERLYNRAWQNEVLAKLAAKDAERKRERDEINNLLRET